MPGISCEGGLSQSCGKPETESLRSWAASAASTSSSKRALSRSNPRFCSAGYLRSGSATITILCFLFVLAFPATRFEGQSLALTSRVVQGTVIDTEDKPQPNAVVYLQNQKTLEIKTYITVADGSYRFGQLSSDVDYRVWAKYKDLKSKTKSISSFDSKKQFTFELKLEPSK